MYFLFGLVKLIFRLPKSEEYLPEGLPGILNFASHSQIFEPFKAYSEFTNEEFNTNITQCFKTASCIIEQLD